jgi:hypothetical protein
LRLRQKIAAHLERWDGDFAAIGSTADAIQMVGTPPPATNGSTTMASLPSSSPTNDRPRGSRLITGTSLTFAIGTALALAVACTPAPDGGDDDTAGMGGTAGAGTAGHGATTGGSAGSTGGTVSGGAGLDGSGGATANGGTAGAGRANGGMSGTATNLGGAGGAGGPSGGAGSAAGGAPMGGTAGSTAMGGRGGRSGGGAPNGGMAGANAGTGGAAGGSAGTTSTGDYHPCPATGDCKILPLGDSITWGIQYDGAYRVELFTKAVADSKKITFTGSLSNGPSTVSGQPFPKANEGHSGWTIDQDAGLIPSPALMTIPNIVLLHIGTNDIYASSGQSTMPDRLGKLVDKLIAGAPDALIVVAKITPLSNSSWNATIKTYNDAIPGVIKTRADAGKHVIGADMNTGFTSGMLSSDGVHPNQSGYDFMGDQFYSVIKSYLP